MSGSGSYTAADELASSYLLEPTHAHVLDVLRALPFPRNTQRTNVRPDGHEYVLSANIGLTTQRRRQPCLSSLVARAPNIVTLLAKFALENDPHHTYTSVTINKNYAANKHRDSSHENGVAKIIALGDFTGGELWIEDDQWDEANGRTVDIKNNWFKFDARKLHATMPFEGTISVNY